MTIIGLASRLAGSVVVALAGSIFVSLLDLRRGCQGHSYKHEGRRGILLFTGAFTLSFIFAFKVALNGTLQFISSFVGHLLGFLIWLLWCLVGLTGGALLGALLIYLLLFPLIPTLSDGVAPEARATSRRRRLGLGNKFINLSPTRATYVIVGIIGIVTLTGLQMLGLLLAVSSGLSERRPDIVISHGRPVLCSFDLEQQAWHKVNKRLLPDADLCDVDAIAEGIAPEKRHAWLLRLFPFIYGWAHAKATHSGILGRGGDASPVFSEVLDVIKDCVPYPSMSKDVDESPLVYVLRHWPLPDERLSVALEKFNHAYQEWYSLSEWETLRSGDQRSLINATLLVRDTALILYHEHPQEFLAMIGAREMYGECTPYIWPWSPQP